MYTLLEQYQLLIPNGISVNQELSTFYNDFAQPIHSFSPDMLDMYPFFNQSAISSPSLFSSYGTENSLSLEGPASPFNGLTLTPPPPPPPPAPTFGFILTEMVAGKTKIMPLPKKASVEKKTHAKNAPLALTFYCDHEGCGRVFTRKYNLRSHRATHSAERKYPCHYCPKAFVRCHDLKRHIRIHTGETPHHCPYCQSRFTRADALQRHYVVKSHCALMLRSDPTNPFHHRRKTKLRSAGSE